MEISELVILIESGQFESDIEWVNWVDLVWVKYIFRESNIEPVSEWVKISEQVLLIESGQFESDIEWVGAGLIKYLLSQARWAPRPSVCHWLIVNHSFYPTIPDQFR